MPEWIYFIHPPRENFAATMTDAERRVWAEHAERLQRLLDEGVLILAGPTLGTVNTGIARDRGARRGDRAPDHRRRTRRSPAAWPAASCGPFRAVVPAGARRAAGITAGDAGGAAR